MDLSGVIFVALAVAWAAYLIPKALRHHEETTRTRSVDRFSDRMRVLAHREVDRREARLVVKPVRRPARAVVPKTPPPVAAAAPSVSEPAASPSGSARRATRRRRRVLLLLLLANAAVAGVAAYGLVPWVWMAAPAGLVVAWLVACRLMVKKERRQVAPAVAPAGAESAELDAMVEFVETTEHAVVDVELSEPAGGQPAQPSAPGLWDPVPVTLPTYVTKEPAQRRSVRTISFDDTGVWTSGRTDADAEIARQAEAQAQEAKQADAAAADERAVGS